MSTFTLAQGSDAEFSVTLAGIVDAATGLQVAQAVDQAKVFGVRSVTSFATTALPFGFGSGHTGFGTGAMGFSR